VLRELDLERARALIPFVMVHCMPHTPAHF